MPAAGRGLRPRRRCHWLSPCHTTLQRALPTPGGGEGVAGESGFGVCVLRDRPVRAHPPRPFPSLLQRACNRARSRRGERVCTRVCKPHHVPGGAQKGCRGGKIPAPGYGAGHPGGCVGCCFGVCAAFPGHQAPRHCPALPHATLSRGGCRMWAPQGHRCSPFAGPGCKIPWGAAPGPSHKTKSRITARTQPCSDPHRALRDG